VGGHVRIAVAFGRELRHQSVGAHVLENHRGIFGGVMSDIDQRDYR
jgi:translation initiation factor IF-3